MKTILYGVIDYYEVYQEKKATVNAHNAAVINALPIGDDWPPLSRGMFAMTENPPYEEGCPLNYRGNLIHFGASLKQVEEEWQEWKVKFEALLEKMLWMEAHVHFVTEYSSVISFEWTVKTDYLKEHDSTKVPPPRQYWEFRDLNDWEANWPEE